MIQMGAKVSAQAHPSQWNSIRLVVHGCTCASDTLEKTCGPKCLDNGG